ncbi:MAG: PEGA domain-containing protein [Bacteroidales bacterium]|nr:PEGA domain-containing protein [Bacteroidales bacterium]
MRKFLLVFLTLISINAVSQIEVKEGSFHKIPDYVMIDKEDHLDGNGNPMALIKITTENISSEERDKLYFKGNLATDFDPVPKIGELYLYLSAEAATFIEIKHPDFGKCTIDILETLGEPLEEYAGYEMILVSNYKPNPELLPKFNYLVINTSHDDAMIYVDDVFIGMKEISTLLSVDTVHTWRIECDLYKPKSGEIILKPGDPLVLQEDLEPDYGYVNITTLPEDSAVVYIDKKIAGFTPYQSGKIKSGSHDVLVMKENFKHEFHTFEADSAQTAYLGIDMKYSVVHVSVSTDSLSKIYINDKYRGEGTWSGVLDEGMNLFEARKKNHKTSFVEKELFIGTSDTIVISSPEPIFSSIDIQTDPDEVDVYIDGEHYGTTKLSRLFVDKIMIGQHDIKFEKDGYALSLKGINVEKDEVLVLNETLSEGYSVNIETDNIGDSVYIDEQYLGVSPLNVFLTNGLHNFKAVNHPYVIENDHFVRKAENNIKLSFDKKVWIESDMKGDIVYVDNVYKNVTPCFVDIPFGMHEITIKRYYNEDKLNKTGLLVADSAVVRRNIIVENDDDTTSVRIPLGKEVVINSVEEQDRIYVNGHEVGRNTSSVKIYLPFEEWNVKLKNGRDEYTESIVVKEKGGEDVFNIYRGQLVIFESDRNGDKVIIDGKKIGETPVEVDVPFGNHVVKVKRNRKFEVKNLYLEKDDNLDDNNTLFYRFTPRRETYSEFISKGMKFFTLNASMDAEQKMLFGLSFGSYKKVGYFFSLASNFDNTKNGLFTGITQYQSSFNVDDYSSPEYYTDVVADSKLSLMGGLMFKTFGPIYLKLGAGYGVYSTYHKTTNDKWSFDKDMSYEGLLISAGLQFNLRNFIMSADVIAPPEFDRIELKLGIGLGWKKNK